MITKILNRFWLAPKSEDSPKKNKIWKDLVSLALKVVLGRPQAPVAELVHELGRVSGHPVGLLKAVVVVAPFLRGGPAAPDVLVVLVDVVL